MMHYFCNKARGRAADQICIDCGGQARDWSQIHGTEGEAPENFEPRCRKCHMKYDDHARGIRDKVYTQEERATASARIKKAWGEGKYADRSSERPDVVERNIQSTGWHHSDEAKDKISESLIGNNRARKGA